MTGEFGEKRIRGGLSAIVGESDVLTGEPMSAHTTFRIGGPADLFVRPHSAEEIQKCISFLNEEGCPWIVIGNGSNLLIPDEGVRGAVICLGREFSDISVNDVHIRAEAGALLSKVAAEAAAASLTGLEFAGGIPGTLGGACVMNAGAYGGEMKQVLRKVTVLTKSGNVREYRNDEMALGYRTSIFQREEMIVLAADLELQKGDPEKIRGVSEQLKAMRQSKQPLDMPSAGSTFKRPEGYFAGKLIMDAGLRGYRVGGAMISEKHCGFVVNCGNATAADVTQLIRDVSARVYEKFGVRLEPEVRILRGAGAADGNA